MANLVQRFLSLLTTMPPCTAAVSGDKTLGTRLADGLRVLFFVNPEMPFQTFLSEGKI